RCRRRPRSTAVALPRAARRSGPAARLREAARGRARARRGGESGPELRVARAEVGLELRRQRGVLGRVAVVTERKIVAARHEEPERALLHAKLGDAALVGDGPIRMHDDLRAPDRGSAVLVDRDDGEPALGRADDADAEAGP